MIILKNGDITLEHDPDMGYAVFRRVRYPSGTTAFWQQVTKWYFYRGWAEKKYTAICRGEVNA